MDGAPGEPDEAARRDDLDDLDDERPQRRAWDRPVAWLAVIGLVLGAGFSSALALVGGRPHTGDPLGNATAVSAVITERGAGSGTVPLPAAPANATALAVRFTCLSAGTFTWGTDAVQNPPSSCSTTSVGLGLWKEFTLPAPPRLTITADQGAEWSVAVVYISRAPGEGI